MGRTEKKGKERKVRKGRTEERGGERREENGRAGEERSGEKNGEKISM